MKKYLWLILLIIIILGLIGYYFYNKNVHDYKSCVKAGGQTGHWEEAGFCKINGETYIPKLPKGAIN